MLPIAVVQAHDPSGLLILTKAYCRLLGMKAATLLTYICNSQEQQNLLVSLDNETWLKFSLTHAAWHTALGYAGVRKGKADLEAAGLIRCQQEDGSPDRTLYWQIDQEKLVRFFEFAHALTLAIKPCPDFVKWSAWKTANPEIVAEFRYLHPRIDDYMPIEMRRTKAKPMSTKRMLDKLAPQKAEQPDQRTCRFVDYWNTLPYVPTCRYGTKSYAKARRFFDAHRHYKAGACKNFMLTEDEARKVRLKAINRIPSDTATDKSGKPIRSDEQMYTHIKLAAKAFDPAFTPIKKSFLGRLPDFLFATRRAKGAYSPHSYFLEHILVYKHVPIDEASLDAIREKAEPHVLKTIDIITRLYNTANRRYENDELGLAEFKIALRIARKISEIHDEIPVDEVPMLSHHFYYYSSFLEWWEQYAKDHLWEGMPLMALHPDKNLFNRFIDYTSADVGWHLLTGERV